MRTSDLTPDFGVWADALAVVAAASGSAPISPSRAALSLAVRGDLAASLPPLPNACEADEWIIGEFATTLARTAASVIACYSPQPAVLRIGSARGAGAYEGGVPVVCIRPSDIVDVATEHGAVSTLDWIAGRALVDLHSRRRLSASRSEAIRNVIVGDSKASEVERLTQYLAHQLAAAAARGDLVGQWSGWCGFVASDVAKTAAETAATLDTLSPLPAAVASVAAIAAGVDVEIPETVAAAVSLVATRLATKGVAYRTAKAIVEELAAMFPESPEEQERNEARRASEDAQADVAAANARVNDPASTEEERSEARGVLGEAYRRADVYGSRVNEANRKAANAIRSMPDPASAGTPTNGMTDSIERGDEIQVSPPGGAPSGTRPRNDTEGEADLTPRTVTVNETRPSSPRVLEAMQAMAAEAIPPLSRLAWLLANPPQRDRHQSSGRFDASNVESLVRGDGRCFARRRDEGEDRVAVTLLVDCSGSMAGRSMEIVRAAAFALATAFRSSPHLDVLVIGHDVMKTRSLDLHDTGDAPENIAGLDARGNNADGLAIEAADALARSRYPRARHAMLLLADGSPSDCSYRGKAALQHVRNITSSLPGAFHAIAWGVPDSSAAAQWGDRYTPIADAGELVEPLVRAVGRIIIETREASR